MGRIVSTRQDARDGLEFSPEERTLSNVEAGWMTANQTGVEPVASESTKMSACACEPVARDKQSKRYGLDLRNPSRIDLEEIPVTQASNSLRQAHFYDFVAQPRAERKRTVGCPKRLTSHCVARMRVGHPSESPV